MTGLKLLCIMTVLFILFEIAARLFEYGLGDPLLAFIARQMEQEG